MQSNMNNAVYRRRRLVSRFNLTMAWLTMAFGLFWLGWIFYTLFYEGFSGLGDEFGAEGIGALDDEFLAVGGAHAQERGEDGE